MVKVSKFFALDFATPGTSAILSIKDLQDLYGDTTSSMTLKRMFPSKKRRWLSTTCKLSSIAVSESGDAGMIKPGQLTA